MKKPSTPYRIKILQLDRKEGLLDDLELEKLRQLEEKHEEDVMDWADAANDYARDEALTKSKGVE
jgi:hypothetical protein